MAHHNYFAVSTYAYGRAQFATVVRVPLGSAWTDEDGKQFWTGSRWDKREKFAKKFPDHKAAMRAMRDVAKEAA